MKKEVSLYKKIKLFGDFKKKINSNKEYLQEKFNIRIDRSCRMYTVINIPETLIGDAYSLRKSDIDTISKNFTREYTSELSSYLESQGLTEMYKVYEIKKVDKYSYLLVFGFSLFQSNKYYNNVYYKILPISIATLLGLIIFLLV